MRQEVKHEKDLEVKVVSRKGSGRQRVRQGRRSDSFAGLMRPHLSPATCPVTPVPSHANCKYAGQKHVHDVFVCVDVCACDG